MDEGKFRDAMGKFATGITVVSMEYNSEILAMTVNAFMSVSLSPKLIAISIDQKARMYHKIRKSESFGISILSEEQELLSRVFAKQVKSNEEVQFIDLCGSPVINGALAMLSCKVVDSVEAGDHIIYIAEVIDYSVTDKEPIVFYGGKYRRFK